MIEFKNITKEFRPDFWAKKFKALDDVSFKIDEGKLIGFLGANGSGKTTSIKILLKFINSTSGMVNYSSSLGKNFSHIISNIGYIPERPYFYPNLTGLEYVTYMGKLSGVDKQTITKRANLWGDRLLISHAFNRPIRSYSKGMLQRIGFTAALIHDPMLLILDEPLSGLDPVGRKDIKDMMLELNKLGKTVFFSSHVVADVEEICEKIVVLEKGKLLYTGGVASLMSEHVKSTFHIHTFKDDKVFKFDVDIRTKESELQKLLLDGHIIQKVEPEKTTLEEIIYKIRR